MEELQHHTHHTLAIFLFFSLFQFISSDYTPPDNYLILCGSTTNTITLIDNRNFSSDSNAKSFTLSAPSDASLTDQNPSPGSSPLYRTARVFTRGSSYEFKINIQGTHVVRLHFFPFSSTDYNLSSAVFNVLAFGFSLLSDFSVVDKTSVAKEYLIRLETGKQRISFTPSANSSSLAFINAIEVYSVPDDVISAFGTVQNQPGLQNFNLSKQALETVYRINVGGPKVTPSNDTLWRTWIPDDDYLLLNNSAVAVFYSGTVIYEDGLSSREIAPDNVYNTARKMAPLGIANQQFNITWNFSNVNSDYKYLVRMHFCDFDTLNPSGLIFDVFINDWSAYPDLQPWSETNAKPSTAFYKDFVVTPSNLGALRVSIGPSDRSNPSDINATLNGLEIMKINNSMGSLDGKFSVNQESGSKKKIGTLVLVAAILGGVALAVLLIVVLFFLLKRWKPQKSEETAGTTWSPLAITGGSSYSRGSKTSEGTTNISPSPNRNLGLSISFADIKFATNNFNEDYIIGSGGFGKVYKGILRDGTKVAVKRAMPESRQGFPEFQTEIMVLSRIRHRHLVSLIGYCEEQSEMILVYEYMERGTLRNHLYGSDLPCLSWKQRLEICIGSARGIHYLHTGSSQGIIHRDVKSANILLNEDYLAKVADFGLSRLGPSFNETHVSTNVKGSFGYLDPEYFKRQQLTDKSDVYSFGVVLLEVLCARPVIDPLLSREQVNLAEWAMQWQQNGLLEQIVDPRLAGKINPNSLRKFGETAEKCLAEYGADRPTISDVLWNLEYALQLQQTAMQREPYEDSNNFPSEIPLPEVRRIPSTNVRNEGERENGVQLDLSTNQVFSQLITDEGR